MPTDTARPRSGPHEALRRLSSRPRRWASRLWRRLPPVRRLVVQRQKSARRAAALEAKLARAARRLAARERSHTEALERTRHRLRESRDRNVALLAETAHLVRPEAEDDLGYLFIVTYGRSGSTLLQAVINTAPGYAIRGENRGAMRHLYHFHRGMTTEAGAHLAAAYSRKSPWWGIDQYAGPAAQDLIRRLVVRAVLRPEADTRVTGFKEIRWWHEDWKGYLDFLRGVFPGARFVFNTRQHADVAKSKWWPQDPDPFATLARMERQMDAMVERLGPEHAFRVHYDDWVADPDRLEPLFTWLGEAYDGEVVRAAMTRRYSY